MNKKQNIYITYAWKVPFSSDILQIMSRKMKVCSLAPNKTHFLISQLMKNQSQVHMDLSILIHIWRYLLHWMICARFHNFGSKQTHRLSFINMENNCFSMISFDIKENILFCFDIYLNFYISYLICWRFLVFIWNIAT